MEFEKNTSYESNAPTDGGEKKGKKKSAKKKLVAPVPIDETTRQAIKNETNVVVKKKERAAKSPKRAEKATIPKEAAKEIAKNPSSKPEATPDRSLEEVITGQAELPKSSESSVGDDEQSHVATEQLTEADEEHETVISLNETSDNEGMIFVSDRLRQQQSPEEAEAAVSLSPEQENEGDIDQAETVPAPEATEEAPAPKKRAQQKPTHPKTSNNGSGVTTGSANRPNANTGAHEAVPVAAAGAVAGHASSSRSSRNTPRHDTPEQGSDGGGGSTPSESLRSAMEGGGAQNERLSARSRIFGNLTPEQAERGKTRRERHGFVQGVLLGAIVEHIRHKRREKRMTKAHTQETKAIKKEHTAAAEKREHSAKREKTTLEKQLERLRGEVTTAHKEVAETQKAQPKTAEQTPDLKQILTAAPTEQQRPVVAQQEAPTKQVAKQAELVPKKPIAEAQARNEAEEALQLPPDHKLESSAWHNIEVDKKTGKAVENPTLTYGEEFKHEQHQEQLRKQIADMSMESDRVRENYLFKSAPMQQQRTTKDSSAQNLKMPTGVTKKPTSTPKTIAQKTQQRISRAEPVDIILWIALFFVLVIIIVLL